MARILPVEDNDMKRDMLSRRLGRAGFEAVCSACKRARVKFGPALRRYPRIALLRLAKAIHPHFVDSRLLRFPL